MVENAEPTKPSLSEFLSVAWRDWGARVSGALSVPFTAVTIFLDGKYVKVSFALLAFVALLFMTYRVWARERELVLIEHGKNAKPEIRGRFIDADFTYRRDGLCITLNVGLVNARPSNPTTIRNPSLLIGTPQGVFEPQRERLPPCVFDRAPDRPFEVWESRTDTAEDVTDLEANIMSQPLAHLTEVTGFTSFIWKGFDQVDNKLMNDSIFTFRVEDSLGDKHEIVRAPAPWRRTGVIRSKT